MDVFYTIIENSALRGMPRWYQAVSILLFSAIVSLLLTMYVLILTNGPDMTIRFGY
ncbi:MAG: hypothetical protein WBM83_16445 [Flavobacteriaceae bacterium]